MDSHWRFTPCDCRWHRAGCLSKWPSSKNCYGGILCQLFIALWEPKVKVTLKRIDHANIFLLIAGSYTPITWLALPQQKAILLMSIIWGSALLGICFRVFWLHAPRWLYVAIYIAMGWGAFVYVVDFMNANAPMMILILVGGLCYTLGAVVYALKKPNPVPGVFGFHEIFHSFTVLAFMCHWTAALLIALSPAAGSFGV
jgi:hemolysin III